jgi:hypothetical protein
VSGFRLRISKTLFASHTDVTEYIAKVEQTRSLSAGEKTALYNDKIRGIAHGWYNKMYDRVLLGWDDATANAIRQLRPNLSGTYTAPVSHDPDYINLAGGGYLKIWTPANAHSSVNDIGTLIGTIGSRTATGGTIDLGNRNAGGTNNFDLFYGYSLAVVSFGNSSTARLTASASTMAEGFYLGSRISTAARLRTYIASTLATPVSGSVSGGALPTHPIVLGGYGLDSTSVDNNTGHKYTQIASFNALTNAEADYALQDAQTLEQELGWR